MKTPVVSLFAGILTLATVQSTKADILFSTNFDGYANANIVGQDSWTAFSGAGATPVQIAGGALVLNQGSGSREDVARNVGATMGAGSTWYYSFDLTVTGGSTAVYFAMFLQGTSTFDGRLYVAPLAGSDFTFGLGGSSIATNLSTGFTFGTVNKVVVAYDFDSGDSTLWVNPTSQTSPSITYDGTFSDAITSIAFRQAAGNSTETIDNLTVATSFSDIIAPVPEPSTIALAGLGGAACLLAFRRRR